MAKYLNEVSGNAIMTAGNDEMQERNIARYLYWHAAMPRRLDTLYHSYISASKESISISNSQEHENRLNRYNNLIRQKLVLHKKIKFYLITFWLQNSWPLPEDHLY